MKSRRLAVVAVSATCALLGTACSSPSSPASTTTVSPPTSTAGATDGGYSSKTPYAPQESIADYQPAPEGFVPVYTESVARHGSRALSSVKYDDLTLQLWQIAEANGALTDIGRELGPAVQSLMKANAEIGYGALSGLGMDEHRALAERVVERVPQLFAAIEQQSGTVALTSSGVDRAVDSAQNFGQGLTTAIPALTPRVAAPTADEDLLYFHKSDANLDYQQYEDGDPRLEAVDEEIDNLPRTKDVARHMLTTLYSESFVDRVAAGEFSLTDRGDGDTTIENEVDAANMLYNTYIITPGMSEEGQWDFTRFVQPEDAQWFAYVSDAEDFYSKGPGFEGNDITYKMASVLRDEFLRTLTAHTAPNALPGADFRFAHAETIIPFAALLQLPGSETQQPEGDLYTYDNNDWRGAQVTPMAANVQWDEFAGPDAAHLVRMLYNERETAFAAPCAPVEQGSFYYAADELARCVPLIGT
ncbi:MAG: histidine-type phosphatase [Rhodococcus sp. (in: high G+C Gram-positive bacteria)]